MRLHSIDVRNFRGFEHFHGQLNEQFTVLVGDNATGKTGLLEALAIGVGSLFLGVPDVPSKGIPVDAVRQVTYEFHDLPDLQPQLPVIVRCEGTLDGISHDWSRGRNSLRGPSTRVGAGDLQAHAAEIAREVREGSPRPLPVLAFYGTQRLWLQRRLRKEPTRRVGNRFDGYCDCLNPASNQKNFERWLRKQELIAAQRGRRSPHVQAVEQAVLRCVRGSRRFFYDLAHEELRLERQDGTLYPFGLLSDGFRNVLAMVADIAWRASVLNPHLGAEVTKHVEGVVLIDEIDLHLHPRWQRSIISDLRSTFPRIQFIVTTHSPFIVQSLRPGELINLDSNAAATPYADRSPEDIVEGVMGVELPQRSERYQRMIEAAERYYAALEQLPSASDDELESLKLTLDELVAPFSNQPAFHAFLKMERLAAEGQRP